jgi:autotransporter-associated beta strand protein
VLSIDTVANSGLNSSIGSGAQIRLGQNAAGAGGTGTLRFTGASGGSTDRTIVVNNAGTGGGGVLENTISGQTLTFSGAISANTPASAATLSVTGAGDVILSGNITGNPLLSFTKDGSGTATLSGASNTATGTTVVNSGSLQVGVAGVGQTGSGAVTINTGATLLGTGTIRGSSFTLNSGATLRPGDTAAAGSHGTLTFTPANASGTTHNLQGDIVMGITGAAATDSTYGGFEIGTVDYNAWVDGIVAVGNHDRLSFTNPGAGTGYNLNFLTTTGSLQVVGSGFTPTLGQVFNLLDWTNLVTANFSGFAVGSNRDGSGDDGSAFDLPDISSSGYIWDISRFTSSGNIVVIPEPSRALLLGLGLALLVVRRRRTVL